MKKNIAFALFLVNIITCYLVGLHYLIKNKMTSYHMKVIGVPWEDLAPGVKTLMHVLKKGIGDALLVGAISMTFILLIPFRREEEWSSWALLCIGLAIWIPMLVGSIYVYRKTGAPSPWQANIGLTAIILVGFFLSI